MKEQELIFIREYYISDIIEKSQDEVKRMNKLGYLLIKFEFYRMDINDGNCVGVLLFEKEKGV